MSSSSGTSSSSSGGIGFTGALTIAFIVLKLTHVINWSWLWVLSPLWIAAAFSIFIIVVAAGAYLAYQSYKDRQRAKRRVAGRRY